ncbi:ankyrin repeat domain-containing protein 13D-like [Centruroides sculpturatus]|uniref:ankyrin repeat domain-containing protein 13D-like n=1 Tax=Centruroides sculpturatus TaxID=218467 RepID=UPI000C6EEBC2|nr:ankyrin repeat domain-containing protein 13D-like [Centruroides sculpturatus]
MMEIDHEASQVYVEQLSVLPNQLATSGALRPSAEAIDSRLTTPIVITYVDTDKISFERNKSGIWGWRSDKTEVVSEHECKVRSFFIVVI